MDIFKWILTVIIQIIFVSNGLTQDSVTSFPKNGAKVSDTIKTRQENANTRTYTFKKVTDTFPKNADTRKKVIESFQNKKSKEDDTTPSFTIDTSNIIKLPRREKKNLAPSPAKMNIPSAAETDDDKAPAKRKAKTSAKTNAKAPAKNNQVSQDKLYNQYNSQYKKINSQCRKYLKKGAKLQDKDKQYLKGKQRELNQIKSDVKFIKPSTTSYKKKQTRLVSQITSLIERISELTIPKSKTIKEDYQEIYNKNSNRIAELKAMDSDLEAAVEYKLREFSLIRWRNKQPIYSNISAFNEAISSSEKDYESSRIKFINKWAKEDKEVVKNLLIRQDDELKDSYNTLAYNASMYKKRMDELAPPYAMLILLTFVCIIILIALAIYIRTFFRNRTIKSQQTEIMNDSIRSINDEKEEPILYKSGLEELRSKAKSSEYYIVDMNTVFNSTTIEKVYISRDCILHIYRFFLEFLKLNGKTNETGCFVIGRWEQVSINTYNISLEEIIEPGNDAIYGEYELDFGTQIGISLESAIINSRQTTQKDYVHTCWIHSHPSIGLFLSNHDLIVQSQLVYSEHPTRMLAIVIDSNTENLDTAFFTYKRSGEMNNKEDIKTILSFEKMAQWAKGNEIQQLQPQKQVITFDPSHYYECISKIPDALIDTYLFSGASIIDIDCMISPNVEGLKGYFYGELLYKSLDNSLGKKVLIENFSESKTKTDEEPIGCLLVLPQFTYQAVLARYETIIENYDFFIVYNPGQDEIRIISRHINGKYLIVSERDLHPISMKELRKWTRRRRE